MSPAPASSVHELSFGGDRQPRQSARRLGDLPASDASTPAASEVEVVVDDVDDEDDEDPVVTVAPMSEIEELDRSVADVAVSTAR